MEGLDSIWKERFEKPVGTAGQLVMGAIGGIVIAFMVSFAVFI